MTVYFSRPLFLVAALVGGVLAARAAADPHFFTAAPGALATAAARLEAGDPVLHTALRKLIEEADEALEGTPPAVTHKTKPGASGSLHDYASQGPFWWPDPTRPDGLPYVARDGRVNPEARRPETTDQIRVGVLGHTVSTLALAYHFTRDEAYAEHAARCLRVWFLDEARRMTPHMEQGQAVPGINAGRAIGIIEAGGMVDAIDASGLLLGSPAWTEADATALAAWATAFLDWLLHSPMGIDESKMPQNHGTMYDVRVVLLALHLGQNHLARRVAEEAKERRIAIQIEPDGSQPMELRRTNALSYSRLNLIGLAQLATTARWVGVDLWSFETEDGRGIRRALDFIAPYVRPPAKEWTWQQIRLMNHAEFAPAFRAAALAYQVAEYEAVVASLADTAGARFQLLRPPPADRPSGTSAPPPLAAAAPDASGYFGARPGGLAESRERLAAGDGALRPALDRLVAEADRALEFAPVSVTQKTRLAPSGDPHDYMSTGPYWWPDPDRPDGLPYRRRDGYVNPESRTTGSDQPRLAALGRNVTTLALAYFFTGRETYAAHAAALLRGWLLDPATRMNPNFNHAQGIPGSSPGRPTGMVEAGGLVDAIDAAGLLAGSAGWGAEDAVALRAWGAAFLEWKLSSPIGRGVSAGDNNQGTMSDLRKLRLALIVGREDLARGVVETFGARRIAVQIAPDGSQPHELTRTKSFGYHRLNLEGMTRVADLAPRLGGDVWAYETADGRSLRGAIDHLYPYAVDASKPWPHDQVQEVSASILGAVLRRAGVAYGDERYEQAIAGFEDAASALFQLTDPPPARR